MKKIFALLLILVLASFLGLSANAQTSTDIVSTVSGPADAMLNTSGLTEYTLGGIVAIVIKVALGLLGIIFLVLIVFSGYRWMTAAGNEEAVNKSKKTIQTAIIGLIIILAAYAITYFVFDKLPFGGSGVNPPGGGGGSGPK